MQPSQRNRWLIRLHRYNGWNLLYLLVTGVVLYLPSLRAVTAPFRVLLKWSHVASGLLMIALLLAYIPLLPGHWARLGRRWGQRLNVLLLLAVTSGWSLTGIVLWLHRRFPPEWASAALLWHDYLTWLILPWLAVHSATRYYKTRWALPGWLAGRPAAAPSAERRAVLGSLAATAAALWWGRWGWGVLTGAPAASATGTTAAGAGGSAAAKAAGDLPAAFDPPHPVLAQPGMATGAPPPLSLPPVPSAHAGGPPPHTAGDPPMPVPMRTPPAGGGREGRFRIYTVTPTIPAFRPDSWRFFAAGLVENPLHLDWNGFLHLPRQEQVSDFHCVTGWSVYRITWEGVRLSDLLAMLKVKPEADHVKFYSLDGVYTDDLSLEVAMQEDIMLAYLIDGELLPTNLGGPMRLVVPRMYAYKSVKWLGGIELIKGPHTGFWEERGYPRDAWLQS